MQCLAFIVAALAGAQARAAPLPALSDDMATIRQRLLSSYALSFNVSGADADVDGYLPLLTPPGIFTDLNYTTGEPTGWGGYDHCTRMAEMGSVYVTPSSKHYNSSAVLEGLLSPTAGALAWFIQAQPADPANWWYQMIGCGRPIAQLTLQFQSQLSAGQVDNATALMDRSQWVSWANTGTNAADIAVVHIGNGLVNGNESYVAEAFAKIWSTVSYSYGPPPSSPEGPKPDGSFMQHGAQLYNGNYGASWTKDVLSNVVIAANTTFNASETAYEVVAHVTLDGCGRMIHWPSVQWDPAVIGRQITNPGGQNVVGAGGDALLLDPAVLRAAGGARAAELSALADALEDPSSVVMPSDFTVYFASDYGVQRRAGYYASTRMISGRTAGGECINGQGLQSLHAADGAQYIMKTGQEYQGIAPTWDWERLPGTTVQRNGTALTCATADGMGSGYLTGGVTADNSTGLLYMAMNNTKHGQALLATKAYFYLDLPLQGDMAGTSSSTSNRSSGFLLNLGAGITSIPGHEVVTTLDSRLLDPAGVLYSSDGGKTIAPLPTGNRTLPAPASPMDPITLVHHQDMTFALLYGTGQGGGNGSGREWAGAAAGADRAAGGGSASSSSNGGLYLLNAPVTGNWSSVGTWPGPPVTNPMFTLSLSHGGGQAEPGVAVTNGSYAYAVWPEMTAAAFTGGAWKAALARYNIISNNGSMQAVWDAGAGEGTGNSSSGTLYAVLYDGNATTYTLPPSLGVPWIVPPFPVAVVATTYPNASCPAGRVFSLTYTDPLSVVSSTGPGAEDRGTGWAGLGRLYPYWWYTGGAFVPCSWPSCPGQWPAPKGYTGPPPLKYNCYANGTIYMENPPSQADMPGGVVPPIGCGLA